MKSKNKELIFIVSTDLSEPEAVSFAKTLNPADKYYLVKTYENPKARHIAERERFVVVPLPRASETVKGGHKKTVDRGELRNI